MRSSSSEPAPADLPAVRTSIRQDFPLRFLAPLFVGSILNPINASIIATSLVPISEAFQVPVGQTAILVTTMYVACAVAQPTFGRLAEQFGARRIFLLGIVLVLIGGAIGTFAPAFNWLVLSRLLIGVGTSASYPTAFLLIRTRAEERGTPPPGRILGLMSVATSATVALGLPLGGFLVYFFSWRAAFAVNIPITLITLVLAWVGIPRDARRVRQPDSPQARWQTFTSVDPLGIALFAGMMTTLIAFLLTFPNANYAYLVPATVLVVAFVLQERRHRDPMIDTRYLMRNKPLSRTYLRTFLSNIVTYSLLYGLTQWLISTRGLSPAIAGAVMLPTNAMSLFLAYPVARGNFVRTPIRVSAVAMITVATTLCFLTTASPIWIIVAMTIVGGSGITLAFVGNQGAMYGQAAIESVGTAAGILRTSLYLGAITASALFNVVFAEGVSDSGLHSMGLALVVTSTIGLFIAFLDRRLPRIIDTSAA